MEVIQKQENATGALSNTTINFFGPAYNAQQADGILSILQNRNAVTDTAKQGGMILQLQNHIADPVGGWIGKNPATGGTIPEGSSVANERYRAATGQENTSHNCYGSIDARAGCGAFWLITPSVSLPINKAQDLKGIRK
jgi:filamentous hemagglutinin